ncbi:MAG: hypothetical protein WAN36_03550 [Calditrichia bacterium]
MSISIIITINNLSDYLIFRVRVPGVVAGLGILILGMFLINYSKTTQERKKLGAIIEKLMA